MAVLVLFWVASLLHMSIYLGLHPPGGLLLHDDHQQHSAAVRGGVRGRLRRIRLRAHRLHLHLQDQGHQPPGRLHRHGHDLHHQRCGRRPGRHPLRLPQPEHGPGGRAEGLLPVPPDFRYPDPVPA